MRPSCQGWMLTLKSQRKPRTVTIQLQKPVRFCVWTLVKIHHLEGVNLSPDQNPEPKIQF